MSVKTWLSDVEVNVFLVLDKLAWVVFTHLLWDLLAEKAHAAPTYFHLQSNGLMIFMDQFGESSMGKWDEEPEGLGQVLFC